MLEFLSDRELLDSLTEIIIILLLVFRTVLEKQKNKLIDFFIKKNDNQKFTENKKIQQEIIELRKEYDFDRVMIYQFHNGEYYIDNSSILKMSMTFETSSINLTPTIDDSQNMLVTKYPNFIIDVLEKQILHLDNMQEHYGNYEIINELIYRGIDEYYAIALMNDEKKFIGILAMAYNKDTIINNSIEIDENKLAESAIRIGYLLSKKVVK